MDSAALLDLLGNSNRRRILRLLARKPCYVTEISEYLGVSPKAVIDHLRKLEEAGLVESRTDDQRRKYFHIARNLRLEVSVSPYGFGTKSAYPASKSLDLTTCRYLTVNVSPEEADPEADGTDIGADGADADEDGRGIATELERLEQLENELSMAQRWVQGRITELLDELTEAVGADEDLDSRLYADVLLALNEQPRGTAALAADLEVPEGLVESALARLSAADMIAQRADGWHLTD